MAKVLVKYQYVQAVRYEHHKSPRVFRETVVR